MGNCVFGKEDDFRKQIKLLKISGVADHYYRLPENIEDQGLAKIIKDKTYKKQILQFSTKLYQVMHTLEKQSYQVKDKKEQYKLQAQIDKVEKLRVKPFISYLRKFNAKILYNYSYQKAKFYYYKGQFQNAHKWLVQLSKQKAQTLQQAEISMLNIKIFSLMVNMNLQIPLKDFRQQSITLIFDIFQEKMVQAQKNLRQKCQKLLFVSLLYYIILLKKTYLFRKQLVPNYEIQEIEGVPLQQIKKQYEYLIDFVRSYRLQMVLNLKDKVIKGSYLVQNKKGTDKSINWQQLIAQFNLFCGNISSENGENRQKIDYQQLFVSQYKFQSQYVSPTNSNGIVGSFQELQKFYVLNLSNVFIARKNYPSSNKSAYSTWIKTYQNKKFDQITKQKYQAYNSKALIIKIKPQSNNNQPISIDLQKFNQKIIQFIQIIYRKSRKDYKQHQKLSQTKSNQNQNKQKDSQQNGTKNLVFNINSQQQQYLQSYQQPTKRKNSPNYKQQQRNNWYSNVKSLKQKGKYIAQTHANQDQKQLFNSYIQTNKQLKQQQKKESSVQSKIQSKQTVSSSTVDQQNNWKRGHLSYPNKSQYYNQYQIIYDSEQKRNQKQYRRGLRNLGNTCYMNSALQCLHKSRHFSQQFILKAHQIKQKSKGKGQFELTEAYEQFIQEMWKTNERRGWQRDFAYEPYKIKHIMGKNFEIFKYYDQNDATQFFSYFIKKIQQELNQPTNQQFKEIDHYKQNDKIIYQKIKYNEETYEKSIIQDTFTGRYKVVFSSTNPRCQHTYTSYQKFNIHILQLPSSKSKIVKLEQCLSLFNKPDILCGDNVSYCDSCKMDMFDNKTMKIFEANKIFAVNFKRFLNNRKNQTIVSAPKILDLTPFVVESERPKFEGKRYRLYAAIIHSGSLHGGHYYAYCYNYKNEKWMEYNDSSVSEVDLKYVDLRGAMTLFYELLQDKKQQYKQDDKQQLEQDKNNHLKLYKNQSLQCNVDTEFKKQLMKDGKIVLSVINWLIRSENFKRIYQQQINRQKYKSHQFKTQLKKAIAQTRIDNTFLEELLNFKKEISINDPYKDYKYSQIPKFIMNLVLKIDEGFKSHSSNKIAYQLFQITRIKTQKCINFHQQKHSYEILQQIQIQGGKQDSNIINDYFHNYRRNNRYPGKRHSGCKNCVIQYQLLEIGQILMVELKGREKANQYINIPEYLNPEIILAKQHSSKYDNCFYRISCVIERKGNPSNYQYSMFYYDFKQSIWFCGSKNQVEPVSYQHAMPIFNNAHFLIYELKNSMTKSD